MLYLCSVIKNKQLKTPAQEDKVGTKIMKTIKDIIEKWDEMYELVMVGTADVNNDSWKKTQQAFMLQDDDMDAARELIKNLCEEWSTLTEDDITNEKDWPIVMKFIGDMLALSGTNSDYPFYIYDGEVGILAYLDDDIIKENGLEEHNGIAFVPGYALDIIPDKEEGACWTVDDSYSCYSGCSDIDNHTIVCMENDQRLSHEEWVTDMYAASDEYVRQLLTHTNSYYDWTSWRTNAIETIEQKIESFDENLCGVDNDEEVKESVNYLKKWLREYKEQWEEIVSEYSDPLGFADSKKETADFLSVLNDVCMPDDLLDETYQAVGEFKKELENETHIS